MAKFSKTFPKRWIQSNRRNSNRRMASQKSIWDRPSAAGTLTIACKRSKIQFYNGFCVGVMIWRHVKVELSYEMRWVASTKYWKDLNSKDFKRSQRKRTLTRLMEYDNNVTKYEKRLLEFLEIDLRLCWQTITKHNDWKMNKNGCSLLLKRVKYYFKSNRFG